MGRQLRSLRKDDTIEIEYLVTFVLNPCCRRLEHFGRVPPAVGWVGVGKHLANVPQRGGPQQSVRCGVQQRVCVAVPDGGPVVGNLHATNQ
jgi:hypothetical protein